MISEFGTLDELIQVIYQGANKFVVLSSVADDAWSVYLTLANSEGRWWTGRWTEKDVLDFVGHKTPARLIEQFAQNLAESVTKGELHVGNWNSNNGADMNLTLGPTSKKPVHVPLKEMTPVEAAKYATKTFILIASYAQERKCRLYPSPYDATSSSSNVVNEPISDHIQDVPKSAAPAKAREVDTTPAVSSSRGKAAEDEIKKLKAELAREKRKARDEPTKEDYPLLKSQAKTSVSTTRKVKGASLANPNKKARKYQALEFEDD